MKKITISEQLYWSLVQDANFLQELEDADLESWGQNYYYNCQREALKQTTLQRKEYNSQK